MSALHLLQLCLAAEEGRGIGVQAHHLGSDWHGIGDVLELGKGGLAFVGDLAISIQLVAFGVLDMLREEAVV